MILLELSKGNWQDSTGDYVDFFHWSWEDQSVKSVYASLRTNFMDWRKEKNGNVKKATFCVQDMTASSKSKTLIQD